MKDLSQTFMYLAAFVVALALPLIIGSYCALRLRWRWRNLFDKIQELSLEKEYLRLFQYLDYEKIRDKPIAEVKESAVKVFRRRFWGENNLANYILPFLLTLATTALFAYVTLNAIQDSSDWAAFTKHIVPIAIAGGLLYVFPQYISRYSSLFLTPASLYELIARLWLAVFLGLVLAVMFDDKLKPVAAFIGGLVPITAFDFLKSKLFQGNQSAESSSCLATVKEIVENDNELLSQLTRNGIRTPIELAYANPLKLFVDTDLAIDVCIYFVDRAQLFLYVPDRTMRDGLNKYGIKTAVDLMTEVYVYPNTWISLSDELPSYMNRPLEELAKILGMQYVDSLRNTIDIMHGDPKLTYLLDFWHKLSRHIEENSRHLAEETKRIPPARTA